MEKFFHPGSIAIFGLSSKENNVARLILGNLIRWGFSGRIFGISPRGNEQHVDGVKMYRGIEELPIVPDLAVTLVPARFIPEVVETCGKFGIKRMAIPAGGFNEAGAEGKKLADELKRSAREYGIRFIGPNGLTVINTANGLCLPFVPLYCPPKGGMSIITQSGGLGLFLCNLMADENIGLAKFASIGNKLDLTEVDFLRYFSRDPATKIICLYVESIHNGRALLEAAAASEKPVVLYKSNTTRAGNRAAMSHTAALSNDETITDAALERAGIIRINNFHDFISVTKAFSLPPMKGDRIMAMSPAGGFSVILADLCEKAGFTFADPGNEFYREISTYGNAGIINVSNPLDMGDMYDPKATTDIFHSTLHNENVDGAVYINQWPRMPVGDDIFTRMFHTDLSLETMGAIRSSGKPLAVCLFGLAKTIAKVKNKLSIPLFNTPEEMVRALKIQQEFHTRKSPASFLPAQPEDIDRQRAEQWITENSGIRGEETLDLLGCYNIPAAASTVRTNVDQALQGAKAIGYPVVMKVVSPDAIHKSEVGGVIVGIRNEEELRNAFQTIESNLYAARKDAVFQGVRVMQMAGAGYDMFVGGSVDDSFGPVVFFGYGGIYVEVFNDTEKVLCPSNHEEVAAKLKRLKSYRILAGTRGQNAGDIAAFTDVIVRLSCLMADFPDIREIDLNPVRILEDGSGVLALDARAHIEPGANQ